MNCNLRSPGHHESGLGQARDIKCKVLSKRGEFISEFLNA